MTGAPDLFAALASPPAAGPAQPAPALAPPEWEPPAVPLADAELADLFREFHRRGVLSDQAMRGIAACLDGDPAALEHDGFASYLDTRSLVEALAYRQVIHDSAVEELLAAHGDGLTVYGRVVRTWRELDEEALESAADAIRRRDLGEAVIQVSRAVPAFADLAHLYALRGEA